MANPCNPYCINPNGPPGTPQIISCALLEPEQRGQFRFNVSQFEEPVIADATDESMAASGYAGNGTSEAEQDADVVQVSDTLTEKQFTQGNQLIIKRTYTKRDGSQTIVTIVKTKPKLRKVYTDCNPAPEQFQQYFAPAGNAVDVVQVPVPREREVRTCTYEGGNYIRCEEGSSLPHCYRDESGVIKCYPVPQEAPIWVQPMQAPAPIAPVAPAPVFDPFACPKYEIVTKLIPQ